MQYDTSGNKVAAVIQGQLTDVVYDGTDIVLLDQLPSAFGVTPPQFDNSSRLATTSFVQGVGGQFSSVVALSSSATLTAAHAGALIVGSSNVSTVNVTLPLTSTMPAKCVIRFWNYGNAMMTLACTGSDTIVVPYVMAALSVPTGSSVTLVSAYGVWYAIDMSGIGVGQTWQNMTAARAMNTNYINNTAHPIMVSYAGQGSAGASLLAAVVGGSNVSSVTLASTSNGTATAIVPVGASYSMAQSSGIMVSWWELR